MFTQQFLINLNKNFSSLFVTYDDVTEAEDSKLKMETARSYETMAPSTNTSSYTPQYNNITSYCLQMCAAKRSLL
jgi:hypothetical protein